MKKIFFSVYAVVLLCSCGGKKSAITPNTPPFVAITSPAEGTSYLPPENDISISVSASDADGIKAISIYSDDNLLAEGSSISYTFVWKNAPAGTHKLTAKAVDKTGMTSTSKTVSVVVKAVVSISADSSLVLTAKKDIYSKYGEFQLNAPYPIEIYILDLFPNVPKSTIDESETGGFFAVFSQNGVIMDSVSINVSSSTHNNVSVSLPAGTYSVEYKGTSYKTGVLTINSQISYRHGLPVGNFTGEFTLQKVTVVN